MLVIFKLIEIPWLNHQLSSHQALFLFDPHSVVLVRQYNALLSPSLLPETVVKFDILFVGFKKLYIFLGD